MPCPPHEASPHITHYPHPVALELDSAAACSSSPSNAQCQYPSTGLSCSLSHRRGWYGAGLLEVSPGSADPAPTMQMFAAKRSEVGCSTTSIVTTVSTGTATGGETAETQTTSTYNCYEYTDCPAVGQLCIYDSFAHVQPSGVTALAWAYLTGGTTVSACAR